VSEYERLEICYRVSVLEWTSHMAVERNEKCHSEDAVAMDNSRAPTLNLFY